MASVVNNDETSLECTDRTPSRQNLIQDLSCYDFMQPGSVLRDAVSSEVIEFASRRHSSPSTHSELTSKFSSAVVKLTNNVHLPQKSKRNLVLSAAQSYCAEEGSRLLPLLCNPGNPCGSCNGCSNIKSSSPNSSLAHNPKSNRQEDIRSNDQSVVDKHVVVPSPLKILPPIVTRRNRKHRTDSLDIQQPMLFSTLAQAKTHLGPGYKLKRGTKIIRQKWRQHSFVCKEEECDGICEILEHTELRHCQLKIVSCLCREKLVGGTDENDCPPSAEDHLADDRGLPPNVQEHIDSIWESTKLSSRIPSYFQDHCNEKFCLHSLFDNEVKRYDMYRRIHYYVDHKKKKERKEVVDNLPPKIELSCEIEAYSRVRRLKIPDDHIPATMLDESQSKSFAAKCGIKDFSTEGCPHHELISLATPSVDKFPEMKRVYDKDPKCIANTLVFTSINLLRTASMSYEILKMEVVGSIDGTEVTNTKYVLVCFGLHEHDYKVIQSKPTNTFKPLVYAFGEGEREEIALLGLLSLKKACKDIFGFLLEIKGGLISDHAFSFTNAYERSFPGTMLAQCYSHVLRKFILGNGNGDYVKEFDSKFVKNVASEDIQNMHRCRSDAMKDKYWELTKEHWNRHGHEDLASKFGKSYCTNAIHKRWNYICFGIPSCYPSNNSNENSNKSIQGDCAFEGAMTTGVSLDRCLKVELPRLIVKMSRERVGMHRRYISALHQKQIPCSVYQDYLDYDLDSDVYTDNDGVVYMNNIGFQGKTIDKQRINLFKKALAGEWTGDCEDRKDYFELVHSLVCVRKKKVRSGLQLSDVWVCDCERFYKKTVCVHSCIKHHPIAMRDKSEIKSSVAKQKKKTKAEMQKEEYAKKLKKEYRKKLKDHWKEIKINNEENQSTNKSKKSAKESKQIEHNKKKKENVGDGKPTMTIDNNVAVLQQPSYVFRTHQQNNVARMNSSGTLVDHGMNHLSTTGSFGPNAFPRLTNHTSGRPFLVHNYQPNVFDRNGMHQQPTSSIVSNHPVSFQQHTAANQFSRNSTSAVFPLSTSMWQPEMNNNNNNKNTDNFNMRPFTQP